MYYFTNSSFQAVSTFSLLSEEQCSVYTLLASFGDFTFRGTGDVFSKVHQQGNGSGCVSPDTLTGMYESSDILSTYRATLKYWAQVKPERCQ